MYMQSVHKQICHFGDSKAEYSAFNLIEMSDIIYTKKFYLLKKCMTMEVSMSINAILTKSKSIQVIHRNKSCVSL